MRATLSMCWLVGLLGLLTGCGSSDEPASPSEAGSPWPKFRANAQQDGRGVAQPTANAALEPWVFPTSRGVFTSPIVGADETIYIGSADRTFYALDPDGSERFHFDTGEIIDSAATLDDRGHVYFGSGDGHVYALDAKTGDELWAFEADDPADTGAFIRWFEGNVALRPDGTLIAPNDNFRVYGIDSETGGEVFAIEMPDQTWSSPAIDVSTNAFYIANNNAVAFLGPNFYAFDQSGNPLATASTPGTIAASPILMRDLGLVAVGGFDGYLRAYPTDADFSEAWSFATRDHIYASAGRLPNGDLVQPSADGTIYSLDASTGELRWAFDTHDPIRSSPAIDPEGHVYVGGGDGRLYVLEPDGTLRYRMQLVTGDRNDINSSPALGRNGVYVGSESGDIFFVPYDYCLGEAGLADPRCEGSEVGEGLPTAGAAMVYTSELGGLLDVPPSEIDANRSMAFSLVVRENDDTVLALIDEPSLQIVVTPAAPVTVRVSADRRFLIVVPEPELVPDGAGHVSVEIRGDYLVNPDRTGLRFTGGTVGGSFDTTFDFSLSAPRASSSPFEIPATVGVDAGGTFEIARLAAPMPTILPSYNQIGFDSIRWLGGMVEGDSARAIAFVVGAMPDGNGNVAVDPATRGMFPVVVSYDDGLLTLENDTTFALEVFTFPIAFERFRFSTRVDAAGDMLSTPSIFVSTRCELIPFYGTFLDQLGFCNPQTNEFSGFGAAEFRSHPAGPMAVPAGVGAVTFTRDATGITAEVAGSELGIADHVYAVLLIDPTTNTPLPIPYATAVTATASGTSLASVRVDFGDTTVPAPARAYLMVDTLPVAVDTL